MDILSGIDILSSETGQVFYDHAIDPSSLNIVQHNDYTMIPREASVAAEKDMLRRMHRQAEIVEALGLLDDAPNQKNGDDIS